VNSEQFILAKKHATAEVTLRRLAAIMACDMVGYSRLTGADEEDTHRRLKLLRQKTFGPRIEANRGRIVRVIGDGFLTEFTSVADAVRSAVEIQQDLLERNYALALEQRTYFRIGINFGDIIVDDDDIYGNGVNIAARLEAMSEPGGIVVSQAVYEEVHNKVPYLFENLGERSFKNIARPICVYRIIPSFPNAAIASNFPTDSLPLVAALPRLSIIVLPFDNLTGDPSQDYFSDSITDDLTTDLSHIPESFVIARNTSFTYKGKAVNVREVGRELGVRYVLEGSVRRTNDQIKINVQLIDATTGSHLWADRVEAPAIDLPELQDEIISKIALALNVELINAESLRGLRERPNNPDAVDLTMRGWSIVLRPHTPESLREARQYFEKALELDERREQALVGLAETHIFEIGMMWSKDVPGQLNLAIEAIAKALDISPKYARAHYLHAITLRMKRKYDAALAALDHALDLDRNLAPAEAQRSLVLTYMGRPDEALAPIVKAFRLSPRDFNLSNWLSILGVAHLQLDNINAAIEAFLKAIAANSKLAQNHFLLAAAYEIVGRREEALVALAEFLKLRPSATLSRLREQYAGSDAPRFLDFVRRLYAALRALGLPE
jgi:TolB-like protein/class 3 adenylate cyclase/cytochrome c-type biogenesis protein CcmH/NrfG